MSGPSHAVIDKRCFAEQGLRLGLQERAQRRDAREVRLDGAGPLRVNIAGASDPVGIRVRVPLEPRFRRFEDERTLPRVCPVLPSKEESRWTWS